MALGSGRLDPAHIKHRKSCQSSWDLTWDQVLFSFRVRNKRFCVRECMIAAELSLISGYLRPILFETRNFFNMAIALYFVLSLVLNSLAFTILFISLMLLPIFPHSIQWFVSKTLYSTGTECSLHRSIYSNILLAELIHVKEEWRVPCH